MINYFQGYEALKLKDDTSLQEMTQDKWLLLGRGNSDSYDFITLRLKIGEKKFFASYFMLYNYLCMILKILNGSQYQ